MMHHIIRLYTIQNILVNYKNCVHVYVYMQLYVCYNCD